MRGTAEDGGYVDITAGLQLVECQVLDEIIVESWVPEEQRRAVATRKGFLHCADGSLEGDSIHTGQAVHVFAARLAKQFVVLPLAVLDTA